MDSNRENTENFVQNDFSLNIYDIFLWVTVLETY